jgi:hypothetical protein
MISVYVRMLEHGIFVLFCVLFFSSLYLYQSIYLCICTYHRPFCFFLLLLLVSDVRKKRFVSSDSFLFVCVSMCMCVQIERYGRDSSRYFIVCSYSCWLYLFLSLFVVVDVVVILVSRALAHPLSLSLYFFRVCLHALKTNLVRIL